MNKTFVATLLLTLAYTIVTGQDSYRQFGEIAKEEIELKEYGLDKNAEAVVLFDRGKSNFVEINNSFDIVFERTTRIKILSEAGVKWAEVEIPFYQEGGVFENVYDIEAYSCNYEDGHTNITQLDVANTYDEKINMYWSVKKFAIPNVKEGSIIEYKYKISSQYKFNLKDWEFQWKIPVMYSEYEVNMIPFYEYSWLLQGANKFDSQNSYVDNGLPRHFGSVTFMNMVHKYVMKDIPAFNNEEFITSINDYIIKLDFQLSKINYPDGRVEEILTSWEKLNKELGRNTDFGSYIKRSEKLASKLISTENIGLKSDKEKFDFAIDYMKRNFNWDHYDGKSASKSPKKFIEEKLGNCSDINLFTIGLLNALGIKARPVLISTRDNGKIKYDYPYAHFFNYVVILADVEGDFLLTDATEILSLNNRIPARCINDKGLIIQDDKVEWIGLECTFPSEIKTAILMTIINNDSLISYVSRTATEYDALMYRNTYTDNIDLVKKKLETNDYQIIDTSITVQNQINREMPYILTFKQISKTEIVNEKIYLSPFLNEIISDNPLKQKDRTYPIDMTYPKKRIFNATILIPEGYIVDYMPTGEKIDNLLFELTYSVNADDRQIVVSFDYYFKKSIYSSKDYSQIEFYFNEIVKKGNERIVLSKMRE